MPPLYAGTEKGSGRRNEEFLRSGPTTGVYAVTLTVFSAYAKK